MWHLIFQFTSSVYSRRFRTHVWCVLQHYVFSIRIAFRRFHLATQCENLVGQNHSLSKRNFDLFALIKSSYSCLHNISKHLRGRIILVPVYPKRALVWCCGSSCDLRVAKSALCIYPKRDCIVHSFAESYFRFVEAHSCLTYLPQQSWTWHSMRKWGQAFRKTEKLKEQGKYVIIIVIIRKMHYDKYWLNCHHISQGATSSY